MFAVPVYRLKPSPDSGLAADAGSGDAGWNSPLDGCLWLDARGQVARSVDAHALQQTRAKATAERFAAAGYVAIVQDTRGAFASEGKYVYYNNDDQDGFDAIEWIVQQPWSNGNVGMWGSSHPGAVQWVAAADRASRARGQAK